jgi:hypothetical protein
MVMARLKKTLSFLVCVVGIQFVGFHAFAQNPIQDALNACSKELKTYCSQVEPGNKRLVACMKAHEDKLSDGCIYGLNRAAYFLKSFAVAVPYVFQQCRADAAALCPGVKIGDGRIISCLKKNEAKVGKPCKTAILDVSR